MSNYSISELEIFAAIVWNGSFRAAAVERGVSPSAISQTMRNLEESLGVRLLNRTTRSIAPTEVGEQLLAKLRPAFDDIAEAVAHVNDFRKNPSGSIRINARSRPSIMYSARHGRGGAAQEHAAANRRHQQRDHQHLPLRHL